jgi:hypothetical protein
MPGQPSRNFQSDAIREIGCDPGYADGVATDASINAGGLRPRGSIYTGPMKQSWCLVGADSRLRGELETQ